MEQGAWGYSWRALFHWGVTILSGGLLWPRMTFWLEKYRTDRTFFGSERFEQGGRWQMLYRPFLPFLIGLILIAIGVVVFLQSGGMGVAIGSIGVLTAAYGIAHFRVHSFRLLMNHKTVGEIGFRAQPRPWRVFRIYLFGYSLVGTALGIVVVIIGLVLIGLFQFYGVKLNEELEFTSLGALPYWATVMVSAFAYFTIFIIWGALKHTFVTLPLARHYAETLDITGAAALSGIGQRDRDELDQAEGFAEALDVGAAI